MAYYRKVGDTESPIRDRLTDDDEEDIDITGATVAITIWERGDSTSRIVEDDTSGNVSIVTEDPAVVKYEFQDGDLSSAGAYLYDWQVTFAGGGIETWPNDEAGEKLFVTDRDD